MTQDFRGSQPGERLTETFQPRREFRSSSSQFKRRRDQEHGESPSPEMETAPPPPLRQREFPQAPLLGSSETSAFNRMMMDGSRRTQSGEGLGLRGQNKRLVFGGFSQSSPHRRAHPLREGRSFAWEPEAAAAIFGIPSLNHTGDTRTGVVIPTKRQNFPFGGFFTAGFPPGCESTANSQAPPWRKPSFLAVQELRSVEEAEDDYDHSSVPSSWTCPEAARPPPRHGARISGVTNSNSHTRLLPQPPNNPWKDQPKYDDEEEEDNAITPNERRRRILGQQEFLPGFHQQVYSQSGMGGDFASAHGNDLMSNDGMGRGRAPRKDEQDRRVREQRESEHRLQQSRLNQTRFGSGEEEDQDSDLFPSARDQTSRAWQSGLREWWSSVGFRQPDGLGAGFGARPAVRLTREPVNLGDKEEDEDDEEGTRLAQILQGSAPRRQEQSSSAHPFRHPVQQPGRETSSTYPRRSSSVSVQTSGWRSPEPNGPSPQSRQRQQRLPGFMQPTQASRRGFSSDSSAGIDTSRPSPRQSFIRRASIGISRGGSLGSHVNRVHGGLPVTRRGEGRGAPFPTGGQSPIPDNDHWNGPPLRPPRVNAMNPFAEGDMDGQSSADEAPAPAWVRNASIRGPGRDRTGSRGGRGRGSAPGLGNNMARPRAINHNHVPPNQQDREPPGDISATTSMAGLGVSTRSGNEAPRNTAPLPYVPPGVQPTGFLSGRAVYPTADGGMMLGENIFEPPKPKVSSKLEQLRAQAAAQMVAIQAQLEAAEEEALAGEAAGMELGLDVEGVNRGVTMEDIGEVEEYDSEWEEDSTGYEDAAVLAALARPAANIADTYSAMDAFGIQANPMQLALGLGLKRGFADDDPDLIQPQITNWEAPRKNVRGRDTTAFVRKKKCTFFESLGEYPELIFELCKHMDPKDLLTLYCIQKDFHETVNGHITHVVKSCARYYAAESARVYPHRLYKSLCVRDPAMRKNPHNWGVARWVPGLKWLQMVAHRERTVQDILACIAREGHRTPKSMPLTVKKIWLIMDIATTAKRISLCHNETWFTDVDCYNAQFFIIKLLLMFNEQMSQHGDDWMMRVFFGQRGLTPLCTLLKREEYLNDHNILKLCIKYSYYQAEEHRNLQMFGVKPEDMGKEHVEGCGKCKIHLFRIDELVMRESTRRKLNLDDHLFYRMLWGHVDPESGKDIEPTCEEVYMSDDGDVEKKRQIDLGKLRTELMEVREIIGEDFRGQKRKYKKAKHKKKLLSHKKLLAKEHADKGFKEMTVEDWDKQAEVDEKRANWFMDHNHPQRSMYANDVPFLPGQREPDAMDYFDIGDDDLPDSEVISAYEPIVYDSDCGSQASSLLDHALVNLVAPGHSSSESEYEAFDEFREFDPTQEWSRSDEYHPGESLPLDVRDSGAIGELGWVKNHKWVEDEPQPVEKDDWWCTTSEESGKGGEDDADDDDL